jgi:hypothetical protein
MNDRELLELAAKAQGWEEGLEWTCIDGEFLILPALKGAKKGYRKPWNPLTDDGDEARLEAALCLDVQWDIESVSVETDRTARPYQHANELFADHGGDKQAARRRAGVRAAAAIGEQP